MRCQLTIKVKSKEGIEMFRQEKEDDDKEFTEPNPNEKYTKRERQQEEEKETKKYINQSNKKSGF
ncbi:MAG TPA: hypothetical protein VIP70_05460 [Nitrososphaeraceae archaeon]